MSHVDECTVRGCHWTSDRLYAAPCVTIIRNNQRLYVQVLLALWIRD